MVTTSKNNSVTYVFILGALLVIAAIAYTLTSGRGSPIIFSPKSVLDGIWQSYKKEYLEPETFRTLDKQQMNVTTSEGQSYTMLRAVWSDDQETFDKSWTWTKDNLKRPNDHLASWLFGERANGTYGVLTDRGGNNAASDADTDMALALIFAFMRWKDPTYYGDAINIIRDIWDQEVVVIKGKPYLAADNVEKELAQKVLINPSYLAPYAYRIFAQVDTLHDWNGVIDTSYDVIEKSITSSFNGEKSANLPPDWITIDKTTGELEPSLQSNLTTNFGYDALRLPWRMSMDWQWNREQRAYHILELLSFLNNEWTTKGAIKAKYDHQGKVIDDYESGAMYGGTIGYFMAMNPKEARAIYETKLANQYNPDTMSWKTILGYYDDNWAWFGIALYNNLLPNLYKQ